MFLQVGKDRFVGVRHIQYVSRGPDGKLSLSGVHVEPEFEAKVIEQLKAMSCAPNYPETTPIIPGWKE